MDLRDRVAKSSLRLERLLAANGFLEPNGRLVKLANKTNSLPCEWQVLLGLGVANLAELRGLISVGRAARRREPVSETVLLAAFVMANEIFKTLERGGSVRRRVSAGVSRSTGAGSGSG